MKKDLSSFSLHLLAMAFMLCDHLWATVIPGNSWLNWVGRLAFPIFAFLIAEGYAHTRDFGRYARRILLFALLSEIPFNLMYSASLFFPFHQNVLWTFLISLYALRSLDRTRAKYDGPLYYPIAALKAALFGLLAAISLADYGLYGYLTVVLFHLFRGNSWKSRLAQFLGMFWIHWVSLGSMTVSVTLLGHSLELPQQAMAILALIPIWLYRGRQGPQGKWVQLAFYSFYPVHMLILGLLSL